MKITQKQFDAMWADRYRAFEADQRTVAERKWRDGLKPKAPQLPCDHGLFGDEHLQLDLVEMLQEPADGGDWTCIACGCENDEAVRYCWHCGCDETGHTADE